MCTGPKKINANARRGFTLIELLVSLVVMALAFTIVWSAFSAVTKAWRRGGRWWTTFGTATS
ncbi:MAG: prepilin-type N-terminal cleavage/methylation domain-containing protein [Kiritimatiellae bacterium]|nr:prepilin-type N-terminal cleavage/methylation domain-containing protein [Kiritimatiellia bacterium]